MRGKAFRNVGHPYRQSELGAFGVLDWRGKGNETGSTLGRRTVMIMIQGQTGQGGGDREPEGGRSQSEIGLVEAAIKHGIIGNGVLGRLTRRACLS